MEPLRPHQREHYRLLLSDAFPVMFSDSAMIGEGKIMNLSVFGCAIECTDAVPAQRNLLVRLLLPDKKAALPIESAEIRWVKGNQVGLRFRKLDRTANLRLHAFVWDRMVERLQVIKRQAFRTFYS